MQMLLRKSRQLSIASVFFSYAVAVSIVVFAGQIQTNITIPVDTHVVTLRVNTPKLAPVVQETVNEPQVETTVEPVVQEIIQEEPKPVVSETKPAPKPIVQPIAKPKPKPMAKPVDAPVKSQVPIAETSAVAMPEQSIAVTAEAKATLQSKLLAAIEREKQYPFVARRGGIEGVVFANVFVNAQGQITRIQIEQGTAHSSLQNATQEALDKVQRNWKPIPIASAQTIRVPIRYSLAKNS